MNKNGNGKKKKTNHRWLKARRQLKKKVFR